MALYYLGKDSKKSPEESNEDNQKKHESGKTMR